LFGLERQVYYRQKYRKQKQSYQAQKVIDMVIDIRKRMPRIGTRKLYHLLQNDLQSMHVGRDKLFKILNANHLNIIPKRSYKVTTNTHHRFYKHKDLVCNLSICRPEQVWVSDITYLGIRHAHFYISFITDAYSKKIVGYNVSDSLHTNGVARALKMAHKSRQYPSEILIHHSDKGLQYCSNEYQQLLQKYRLTCSMTEQYDPYSNAVAERVNGIIKNEFNLEQFHVSLEIMQQIISETVEIYNNERPHFSCHLLTPKQMHNQSILTIKTYKSKNRSQNILTSV
jgi:transposase InsO family protein